MSETHLINIDLEVESKEDIDSLVRELESKLHLMTHHNCHGIIRAGFEASGLGVEEIILSYILAIETLTADAKKQWNKCLTRDFNFGFQAGETPNGYEKQISLGVLESIASVGGQIVITIYPKN